jgi:hypothetical protein
MIPKSVLYKLVRKADGMIVNEGSAADMRSLAKRKENRGLYFIGLSPSAKVGEKW